MFLKEEKVVRVFNTLRNTSINIKGNREFTKDIEKEKDMQEMYHDK